jgi:hypothetical protein
MPTVLRVGPYRFFFYAGDRDEPAHIHVEREDKVAKFWLDPIRTAREWRFFAGGSWANRKTGRQSPKGIFGGLVCVFPRLKLKCQTPKA